MNNAYLTYCNEHRCLVVSEFFHQISPLDPTDCLAEMNSFEVLLKVGIQEAEGQMTHHGFVLRTRQYD